MHDAGLAGFANLGKGAFIGRDTVAAGTEKPAAWQFAGFVVDSPDADPLPSDPILLDGRVVGYVTSGSEGFRIGKRLALGYVEGGLAETGRVFDIEILGRKCTATVTEMPFYDPENDRLKS